MMYRTLKPPPRSVSIHSFLNVSEANGPGKRAVIWFQGCSRGCPGCCNPDMQDSNGRRVDVMTVKGWIMEALGEGIEGITLTGGEPLEQCMACLDIIKAARGLGLSTVLYTGYPAPNSRVLRTMVRRRVWDMSDIVVSGPYYRDSPDLFRPVGSTNKRLIFNGRRYTHKDLDRWGWAEVQVRPGGGVVQTGVMPDMLEAVPRPSHPYGKARFGSLL